MNKLLAMTTGVTAALATFFQSVQAQTATPKAFMDASERAFAGKNLPGFPPSAGTPMKPLTGVQSIDELGKYLKKAMPQDPLGDHQAHATRTMRRG